MPLHEIVLPITKPETEWVRGRALQKTGGTYAHSLVQMQIALALLSWAERGGHGRVAPSWRFRVAPPGRVIRPLVPDVAYLSYDAVPADAPSQAVQVPLGAPTVAVEVLSEDDIAADIWDKIATYLSAGCSALIVIDPQCKAIAVHDPDGVRIPSPREMFHHAALPGFELNIGVLFDDG